MNIYVIKMLRHLLMSLFTKFAWKNLPNTMCTLINPKVPHRLPHLVFCPWQSLRRNVRFRIPVFHLKMRRTDWVAFPWIFQTFGKADVNRCPVLAYEIRLGGGRRNLWKTSLRLDVRLRQSVHQSLGKKMLSLVESLLLGKGRPCFTIQSQSPDLLCLIPNPFPVEIMGLFTPDG